MCVGREVILRDPRGLWSVQNPLLELLALSCTWRFMLVHS